MSALAGFIMRGRSSAILVISALTILSWLVSVASLLAAAALALPTLRRGAKEGALLLAGALPVVALAGQLIMGDAVQAAGFSLITWIPVFLIALVLRESQSLAVAILATIGIGLLMVIGFFAVVDDPATFWSAQIQTVLRPILEQQTTGDGQALVTQTLASFSRYATGAISAGSVISVLMSLLIARWWQSSLFNPGGFGAEFRALRLPSIVGGFFIAVVLVVSVAGGEVGVFAANLLLPAFMGLLLQGFSVVHALSHERSSGKFWLTGLYIGIMFFAPLFLVVALMGLSDPWLNWRMRFKGSST